MKEYEFDAVLLRMNATFVEFSYDEKKNLELKDRLKCMQPLMELNTEVYLQKWGTIVIF